ncbi:hypothetical protein [Erysipelothrix anatis]|uniref:hypothetical protein n=1 Tax=Erysipelothrix anatis TaxID=2683713 RepID=UPI00140BF39C|nr:hypothetical protein [Erysipelothrix anatis]
MNKKYNVMCSKIENIKEYVLEVDGKNYIDAILNMLEQVNTGELDLSTFQKEKGDDE